jgi:hypothetical protein
MSKKLKITKEKQISLDGMMTVSQLEDGRKAADFMCCENVEMEPFSGTFKVQGMHDGNLYMTEKPKRKRNQPVFREDNASLSLGSDGFWYFVFRMQNIIELPGELIRQASIIARKVIKEIINK